MPNQVYFSGLPPGTTMDEVAGHFGSIGVIKMDKRTRKPKIWLYTDKMTGEMKGDGTLDYEDACAVEVWLF